VVWNDELGKSNFYFINHVGVRLGYSTAPETPIYSELYKFWDGDESTYINIKISPQVQILW
jgi:hypothetical protein